MKNYDLRNKIFWCLTMISLPGTVFAQAFELPDEDGSIFEDSKISATASFLYWATMCAAGLIAVALMLKAGTYSSRGDYAKAAGSVLGAAISGTALYLVYTIQA